MARRMPTRVAMLLFAGLALAGCSPATLAPAPASGDACSGTTPYRGPARHAPVAPDWRQIGLPLDGALDRRAAARLDLAFDAARTANGAVALTAAVGVPGKGIWVRTAGAKRPLFYWASAGKQATAAVVLQLVEEGKMRLSDPVGRWIEGLPNGDLITVEHLLNHTSGLFSANEDERVRGRNRWLPLAEESALLRRRGAQFCPGAAWRYSNSGYALLGHIIEKVDGRDLAQSIRVRLLGPAGAPDIEALSPGASVARINPAAPATAGEAIDLTMPWAAGPIAATAADMARLQQALLDGRLLRPDTRARALSDLYPMFDAGMYYGLGTIVYDVERPGGNLFWIGHSGGTPGIRAITAYSPADNAFVAVALTGNGSAEATAALLLDALSNRRGGKAQTD